MARREFKLPDIGEGTAEAELVEWNVDVGDVVEEDQPLCSVMTDKATVEVTAPFDGKVIHRTGNPGDMLPVGSVILTFEVEGEGGDAAPAVQTAPAPRSSPVAPPAEAPAAKRSGLGRVLAAPAVRKRAADLGIDLGQVAGSGPGGRIVHGDLDRRLAASASAAAAPRAASPIFSDAPGDGVEEVPVIGLRRKISERLQDTKRRIPHFSYIEEIDVTKLEALRASMNEQRREGDPKLTILPFLIRAMARVLPQFPQINALYDDAGGVVRRYSQVHAGIATQTPSGLVVTVVRDAGQKSLWNLAAEVARLANAARDGKATGAELSGSTITITSLGAIGGVATTPVINSPEVAIIGVNKIVERPVVDNGEIRVARMMNLSSSFDHRVVDGWDAAQFVQAIKAQLEDPLLMLA